MRTGRLAAAAVSLGLSLAEARPAELNEPGGPIEIGSRLELFVDDFLVESMDGLELRLHSPRSAGKIVVFDRPWEGTTSVYHTVFKDGDGYRLYYRGSSSPDYADKAQLSPGEKLVPDHASVTCLLESRDGIEGTRPSLGLVEFQGSTDNNIVWKGMASCCFAPFKDDNPDAPPGERYKALGNAGPGWPNHVLKAFVSADGKRWRLASEEAAISDGKFDSLNVPFWDPVRRRYAAVYRDSDGVRSVKYATSQDFLNWTPGTWADYGGTPREHLYTNGTHPYFRAPHILIALPKRFVPWRTHHSTMPTAGVSEAVFMSSRDGIHWDRRFMEAFIRPGRDPRNWVHRTNMPSAGVVPTADDEMSLYVSRHYTFPSAHLERMVLRTDGFVSIHAGHEGGEWVSRPLVFAGGNLVLNFATSAAGSIRLELQDKEGRPLPGFALEESPLIWGDEIEHTVRWERSHGQAASDQPLKRIAGKPVRLRFVMRDADLYSLRFR